MQQDIYRCRHLVCVGVIFYLSFSNRAARSHSFSQVDSDKYPALMTQFLRERVAIFILFKDGKELERTEGFLPAKPLMEKVK